MSAGAYAVRTAANDLARANQFTVFVCPYCADRFEADPSATVTHHCPRNRKRTTSYRPESRPS